jgi:RNA polymerase sigma-70 factor (ECF subfamily)
MGAAARILPIRMDAASTEAVLDPASQADLALMQRVHDGDRDAVIGIVERYQDELVGFFYHLAWDQPTARLRTWLYRIAHNLWIDHLRRKRHHVSLDEERGEEGLRLAEVLPAPAVQDPEAAERDGRIRSRVREALEGLPEGQREVFVMANNHGMKYHEIGEVLGIPEGTVKSRMHHAVRFLRDELSDLLEP